LWTARGTRDGFSPSRPNTTPAAALRVVGSGPAGLAAAQQLRRVGHAVTVYEKNDRIGGLMRYGIPNFKLEKHLLDRRIEQMREEGVDVCAQRACGRETCPWESLVDDFDAVLLAGGSEAAARPGNPRPRAERGFILRWSFCRSRTGAARAICWMLRRRSTRRASGW